MYPVSLECLFRCRKCGLVQRRRHYAARCANQKRCFGVLGIIEDPEGEAVKTRRHFTHELAPLPGGGWVLAIRGFRGQTLDVWLYLLKSIPVDFGEAGFELRKLDGSRTYAVLLSGQESTCECRGFLLHGHCKHLDALRELVAEGQLATPSFQGGKADAHGS